MHVKCTHRGTNNNFFSFYFYQKFYFDEFRRIRNYLKNSSTKIYIKYYVSLKFKKLATYMLCPNHLQKYEKFIDTSHTYCKMFCISIYVYKIHLCIFFSLKKHTVLVEKKRHVKCAPM